MEIQYFESTETKSKIKSIVEDFHDEIRSLRKNHHKYLFTPSCISDFNNLFNQNVQSLEELREVLYQKIDKSKDESEQEKLKKLALINPDLLWSEIESGDRNLSQSREELIKIIAGSDSTFFTEEEYWSKLDQNEKTTVISIFASANPGEFIKKGFIFDEVDIVEKLIYESIETISAEEALAIYIDDYKAINHLSPINLELLESKISNNLTDNLQNDFSTKGINPYLYIDKISENGSTIFAEKIRDELLKATCNHVDKNIEEIKQNIEEQFSKNDKKKNREDIVIDIVSEFIFNEFPVFNSFSRLTDTDKSLIKTYLYAKIENAYPEGEIKLISLYDETKAPPRFIERLIKLPPSTAAINSLARITSGPELHISEEDVSNYIEYINKHIFTPNAPHRIDIDIEKIFEQKITTDVYIYLLDIEPFNTENISTNKLLQKIPNELKIAIFKNASEDQKLRILVDDVFDSEATRKQLYQDFIKEAKDWKLSYVDFLYLKKASSVIHTELIKKNAILYSEIGQELYERILTRFDSLIPFYGKSSAEIEIILANYDKLSNPVKSLLNALNIGWVTENLTTSDTEYLNLAWEDLSKNPLLLNELLKLSYFRLPVASSSWNFNNSDTMLIEKINKLGLKKTEEEIDHLTGSDLTNLYQKTKYLDKLKRFMGSWSIVSVPSNEKETQIILSNRLSHLSNLLQEYLIYRLMRGKYGLSDKSISNLINIINTEFDPDFHRFGKYETASNTLSSMFARGVIGKRLLFVSEHLEEIVTLLEQGVTYQGDLTDYFDLSNPEKSLNELKQIGGKYNTDIKESKRLASVVLTRVLLDEQRLFFNHNFHPRREVESDYEIMLVQGLEAAFEYNKQDLDNRTKANLEQVIGESEAVEMGDLIHWVREVGTVEAIIESRMNYPKEILGQKISGSDSYPGYVDCQEFDQNLRDEIQSLNPKKKYSYYDADNYFIVYDKNGLNMDSPLDSEHYNHRLIPGALPFFRMKSIVIPDGIKENSTLLNNLKRKIVKSGVYVPIYARNLKDVLFDYEEYQELIKNESVVDSLANLSLDDNLYPIQAITGNTDGETTLLEHCNLVRDNACKIARDLGISEEYIEIINIAGKLHDIGKNLPGMQEITNTLEANKYLEMVPSANIETKKRILMLIRNDELLGEILKEYDPVTRLFRTKQGKQKFVQFNNIFSTNSELKMSMISLYLADVMSYGTKILNEENQIIEKLEALGLISQASVKIHAQYQSKWYNQPT